MTKLQVYKLAHDEEVAELRRLWRLFDLETATDSLIFRIKACEVKIDDLQTAIKAEMEALPSRERKNIVFNIISHAKKLINTRRAI